MLTALALALALAPGQNISTGTAAGFSKWPYLVSRLSRRLLGLAHRLFDEE